MTIKIECGNSIDAAFWAHDLDKPNLVYVFSGHNFYVWNTSNNTIESKHVTNETWSNLPANVDAACSFYFHNSLFHIFLKVRNHILTSLSIPCSFSIHQFTNHHLSCVSHPLNLSPLSQSFDLLLLPVDCFWYLRL